MPLKVRVSYKPSTDEIVLIGESGAPILSTLTRAEALRLAEDIQDLLDKPKV